MKFGIAGIAAAGIIKAVSTVWKNIPNYYSLECSDECLEKLKKAGFKAENIVDYHQGYRCDYGLYLYAKPAKWERAAKIVKECGGDLSHHRVNPYL